jgi:tripartite-type tricarboxylate transporter receptor subunit TctC
VLAAAIGASGAHPARAAGTYPDRAVRLIVPFSTGGATDIMARRLAQHFTEDLKQPLVIENRGGAGGIIGTQLAAQAPADGYTLLFASSAQLAINPSLYKHVPYDPVRSFAPVMLVGATPNVLLATPASGIDSLATLIARAKAHPGEISFASPGIGSTADLAAQLLQQRTGISLINVPYKGGGAVMMDALGGQMSVILVAIPSISGYAQSGKLKALAVTSAHRSPILPNVPTISETLPGFEAVGWYGILAPAGTPPDIIAKLHAELAAAVEAPDVRRAFAAQGIEPLGGSAQYFGEYIRSEGVKWAKVIKASGARAN